MKLRSSLIVLIVAAAVVGCGGGSDSTSPPAAARGEQGRPVTDEQALVLARVLQENWRRGGAAFAGEVEVSGIPIPMTGRVDFRSGRGTATLREPSAASRRYVWTRRVVYAQSAPGSRAYTRQAPNPDNDAVHAAIAMINLLSAETIDNTANIRDQGARFLGRESLDGTPVDVYKLRAGGATTYWIGRQDGLLRRLEARFPTGGRLVVSLTEHEPVRVALPQTAR